MKKTQVFIKLSNFCLLYWQYWNLRKRIWNDEFSNFFRKYVHYKSELVVKSFVKMDSTLQIQVLLAFVSSEIERLIPWGKFFYPFVHPSMKTLFVFWWQSLDNSLYNSVQFGLTGNLNFLSQWFFSDKQWFFYDETANPPSHS